MKLLSFIISDAALSGNLEKWDDFATDLRRLQDSDDVWFRDTDEKGCLVN